MNSSFQFKKTKIVATIGPASESEDVLRKLIHAGVSVARLNFSHGTHAEHLKKIVLLRKFSKEFKKPIGIIQDLQGPKIRLGNLTTEPVALKKGQNVILVHAEEQTNEAIPVQFNIFPYLKKNDIILINDGAIRLSVKTIKEKQAECTVVTGGLIRSHKGVNLPKTALPNISLTEKDKTDLKFGIEQKVDYVAISFVQDASDIIEVRKHIQTYTHQPKIIAKIERMGAVKHLEEIIKASDAVMVARGDLAVEVGQEEVPLIQRKIIDIARKYARPVIVATQMLESMIASPEPTRAEVNDVATAVLDEVDGVMLSAESAQGEYPVEAVSMMDRIIKRVERYSGKTYVHDIPEQSETQLQAIAAATEALAKRINARVIFTLTESGKTPRELARFRPDIPVIAITDNLLTYNQLSLVWGAKCFYLEKIKNNKEAFEETAHALTKENVIRKGEKIILVSGTHPGISGYTNTIQVETVG